MTKIYEDGKYLENNPSWHEEDSPWKASQISKMMDRNRLDPTRVCEIGCGAGEILHQLSEHYPEKAYFGYEISPQAYEMCQKRSKGNLTFHLRDLLEEDDPCFDLVLVIDVIEHVEDCFGFLRKLKETGEYKMFHIPLDLSVQTVLRSSPITKARASVGHIHYFSKETALETLKDTGYEIVDHFYTCGSTELPNRGWKANLMNIPRKLAYSINQDYAVRIMGRYSLMVLAK